MQKFKQSQAVYMYIRARVKINQCIKTIPFMDERRKFWFLQEGTRENSRKKMKSARTSANDGTVPETCDSKGLNVNLRSARDVKSQPRDWATCLWITVWTRRRHFSALCLSCHRKPRKTVGRSHILFAEQVVSSRLGACVPYGPRALTKVNMVGSRERNPLESTTGQEGLFFKVHNLGRWPTSGVDRPQHDKGVWDVLAG